MTGIITRISHPRPRTRPCLMISSFSGLDGPLAFEPQATVRPYACLERLTVPVRPYVVSFFLTTESGSRGSPCDPPAIKNMHEHTSCEATRNKCIATSNKCLASSNKKLVETSALLVETMFATVLGTTCIRPGPRRSLPLFQASAVARCTR